jgi:hypothetical protein
MKKRFIHCPLEAPPTNLELPKYELVANDVE